VVRRKTSPQGGLSEIVSAVAESFGRLLAHPAFEAWKNDGELSIGDMVAFNNSFVFRSGVGTRKNEQYLAIAVGKGGALTDELIVCEGIRFNADFKLLSAKSKKQPMCRDLEGAVRTELKGFGKLVFLLVGSVEDTVVLEEPLEDDRFDALVLDPKLDSDVDVRDGKVYVREIEDETHIWDAVRDKVDEDATPDALEELKQKIGAALDSLGARTYATLKLPIAGSETESSVLRSITAVLIDEKKNYEVALTKCRGDYAVDASAYNDVLRIAYNFASDAIGFLRLLTSICDMKPILLWCTVGQQFELSEAFKSLPWTRSTNKPSLSNYERIIGDARNKAFHRLFPFNKPIDVILPGASLSEVRLRIFSEYTKRKENELTYQDKGMVDLMKEFTITKEHSVPSGFWSRNLGVMSSTVEVFQGVTRALELLLRIHDS
jgi:hypothetical protein